MFWSLLFESASLLKANLSPSKLSKRGIRGLLASFSALFVPEKTMLRKELSLTFVGRTKDTMDKAKEPKIM